MNFSNPPNIGKVLFDKLEHEMYLNICPVLVYCHICQDKLEHEMYLNSQCVMALVCNSDDKLEHEMYLNLSFVKMYGERTVIN